MIGDEGMRKLLKHYLPFVVAILLLLCLPAMATAETVFLTDATIYQSISDGETIYLLTADGILAYGEGTGVRAYSTVSVITDVTMQEYDQMDASSQERVEEGITHIFMGNDGLWGLNAYAGLVGRIDDEGVHFADVTFDTSNWFYDGVCPIDTILNAFAEDETVYLQMSDGLHVWRTDTAKAFQVSIPAVVFQCIAYKPHQALLNIQASDGVWATTLFTLDLDTWQVQPLSIQMPTMEASDDGVSITRMAWNEKEQRLVVQVRGNGFVEDGMICQSVSGSSMEKLSVLYAAGTMHLLTNGTLVWIQDGQAICYTMTQLQAMQKTTLVMKGLLHQDDAVYQSFLAQNPHINLLRSVSSVNGEDVEALVNQSGTTDVFALYANQLYQDILHKGYALPLLDQESVNATVEKMYPIFQSLLRNDSGQVVAMPTMVSINLLSVNQELWRETFGEETPYPYTYQELFQVMIEWEESYADAYSDVNVTDDWSLSTLLSRLIDQYIITFEKSNEPLSFDDPILTETLDTFLALKKIINQKRFEQNAILGNETLFSTCNLVNLFQMDGNVVILPPLQMDGNQTVIRTDVVVLLGNRSTQMPEDVTSLIAHLSQPDSLSVEMRYALFSTYDQPLTYLQGKTERTVTQTGIQAYRNMLPSMKLSAASRYLSQSDSEASFAASIQPYIQQFVFNAITIEQFCNHLSRISNMIWME